MDNQLRADANMIINSAIQAVKPDKAVRNILSDVDFPGRVLLVAVGKAAWQMANTAYTCLGEQIDSGIIITKYNHIMGPVGNCICCEAGHPVPDENSFAATQKALSLVSNLSENDTVLFLLSGGGSALFEKPLISGKELQSITKQLLACGADIKEINTIRKHLSAVKGGKFAQHCAPAHVFTIVLSDILGDPLDMIASGPAYPDSTTCQQARSVANKYGIILSQDAHHALSIETPKMLTNVTTHITGSVRQLCAAASATCLSLGYEPILLTDMLCCQAKEAGSFLASILRTQAGSGRKLAFLAGGETVVHLTGTGKGGRNQELALSAAMGIDGLDGAAVFSFGSDGTDGPTDAAGGYVDGSTAKRLASQGIDIATVLKDNDAYHALQKCDGLIITGPTGTTVNDLSVALLSGR